MMTTRRFLRIAALILTAPVAIVARAELMATPTYYAEIAEIPGTNSSVTGTVVVFANGASTTGYAGIVTGLPADLNSVDHKCTAASGCGVRIDSGTSCETTALQGGHNYLETPDTADPWIGARYATDASGVANFRGMVDMGTDDVEGRAFVVHAENGSSLGCGLLKSVPVDDLLVVKTDALTNLAVTSTNTVFVLGSMSCFFGTSATLESNVRSYLIKNGTDCNAPNGCGVHIHSGTDCSNSSAQAGHLYNTGTLFEDPWALVGYVSTDTEGSARYTGCVETGITAEFEGRGFVVHDSLGWRVSCGILETARGISESSSLKLFGHSLASSTVTMFVSWFSLMLFG